MSANVLSGRFLPLDFSLSRVQTLGQVLNTPTQAVPAPKDLRIFLRLPHCFFSYPLSHAGRATNTRPAREISPPCL